MKVCDSYTRQHLNEINKSSQYARISNQMQHYPEQNQQSNLKLQQLTKNEQLSKLLKKISL